MDEVVQMRNIVEEMRNECQSSTEQLIFNDKMLNFLNKNRRLKKYENDKKKMTESEEPENDLLLSTFK